MRTNEDWYFNQMILSCEPNIFMYVSWSTSELRVTLVPVNKFKPSIVFFNWPFQGGASFGLASWFFCVLCFLVIFSIWCLGSDVVLDVSISDLCHLLLFGRIQSNIDKWINNSWKLNTNILHYVNDTTLKKVVGKDTIHTDRQRKFYSKILSSSLPWPESWVKPWGYFNLSILFTRYVS